MMTKVKKKEDTKTTEEMTKITQEGSVEFF